MWRGFSVLLSCSKYFTASIFPYGYFFLFSSIQESLVFQVSRKHRIKI